MSLIAGQSITLFIAANPTLVDLDLYLYDDLETQVDAAMGTGSPESLVVPADGDYFIEVRAIASASNYNLTIGQSTSTALTETLRLSDEFVPGEVIVRFEDDDSASEVLRSSAGRAQLWGMQTKAGAPGRGMLLRFDEEAGPQETFRALGIRQTESNVPFIGLPKPRSNARRIPCTSSNPYVVGPMSGMRNPIIFAKPWQCPMILNILDNGTIP